MSAAGDSKRSRRRKGAALGDPGRAMQECLALGHGCKEADR
jgi:hypothetical protein